MIVGLRVDAGALLGAFVVGVVRELVVVCCFALVILSLRSRIRFSSLLRRRHWSDRALWVVRLGKVDRMAF